MYSILSLLNSREIITLFAPNCCQNFAACKLTVLACVLMCMSISGANSFIFNITPGSEAIIASALTFFNMFIWFSISS